MLIFIVLRDFKESLKIVTDSQYEERVVLHTETTKFIPDDTKLTLLFIQVYDIIRSRHHPMFISHIQSNMGLPGPLAQKLGKLKYVHHTIDAYSGFKWETALNSETADSVITHLLKVMAIIGIPVKIKTDNAPAKKMK